MDYSMILILVVMVAVFYFMIIRPEKKKKKEEENLRNSLKEGDKITTIGGIVGKIVDIKGDNIVIETSMDRVRMELAKWSVMTNNTAQEAAQKARAEAQAADQAETVTHGDGAPPFEVGIRIREKPGQHVAVRVDPIGDGSDAVGHRNLAAARSLGGGGNGHHDDGRRHQQFLDHCSLFFRFYDC